MNEKQLKKMYQIAKELEATLAHDSTNSHDLKPIIEAVAPAIWTALKDLICGEYYTTELKRFDT